MDLTNKYVKMCLEAPEELWGLVRERNGTFFYWRSFLGILVPTVEERKASPFDWIPEFAVMAWLGKKESLTVLENISNRNLSFGNDKGTPLYRQDQLQQISGIEPLCNLMHDFHEFIHGLTTPDTYIYKKPGTNEIQLCPFDFFDTMEQLWLAWLMWTKYRKVWDLETGKWEEK